VPEPLRHHGQVDALGEQERRVLMAEPVEGQHGQIRSLNQLLEALCHELRQERRSVLAGQDPVAAVPLVLPRLPVPLLRPTPLLESSDSNRPESDAPVLPSSRFRLALDCMPAGIHSLATDDELADLEIDITPLEPEKLTPSRASEDGDLEQRSEPVLP